MSRITLLRSISLDQRAAFLLKFAKRYGETWEHYEDKWGWIKRRRRDGKEKRREDEKQEEYVGPEAATLHELREGHADEWPDRAR